MSKLRHASFLWRADCVAYAESHDFAAAIVSGRLFRIGPPDNELRLRILYPAIWVHLAHHWKIANEANTKQWRRGQFPTNLIHGQPCDWRPQVAVKQIDISRLPSAVNNSSVFTRMPPGISKPSQATKQTTMRVVRPRAGNVGFASSRRDCRCFDRQTLLLSRQSSEENRAEHDEKNVWKPNQQFRVHMWIAAQCVADDHKEKVSNSDDQCHGKTDRCFPAMGGHTKRHPDNPERDASERK